MTKIKVLFTKGRNILHTISNPDCRRPWMNSTYRIWDGNEWQAHIQLLLKRRYTTGDYQEVPDTDGGDCGIEGFSRDGCAYQCYAAEEPLNTPDLYENQRRKMTTDIGKFIRNKDKLKPILGTTRISKWVFVVPRFESSKLIQHGEKKAEEVRRANLTYVADDFCVAIITDEDFAYEKASLIQAGLASLEISITPVEQQEIQSWLGQVENLGLVRNLETKSNKLSHLMSEENKSGFKNEMIRCFISGQSALNELYRQYPDIYEKIRKCKSTQEHFLSTECFLQTGTPSQTLIDTIKNYHKQLDEILKLTGQTSKVLVYEAISDWLMRCPLDFIGGATYEG
jgi:hypothetical protein